MRRRTRKVCTLPCARTTNSPPRLACTFCTPHTAPHTQPRAARIPGTAHSHNSLCRHVRRKLIRCQGAEGLHYGVVSYMPHTALSIMSGMVDSGDNLGVLAALKPSAVFLVDRLLWMASFASESAEEDGLGAHCCCVCEYEQHLVLLREMPLLVRRAACRSVQRNAAMTIHMLARAFASRAICFRILRFVTYKVCDPLDTCVSFLSRVSIFHIL